MRLYKRSLLPSSFPFVRVASLCSHHHSKYRYILGASPNSNLYLSTTLGKFLNSATRKSKLCGSYRLSTSSIGVLTAIEQAAAALATATARNQRPRMSESIRDVSRLLPAPFPSNVCFVLLTSYKHMPVHRKEEKRWEDVLYFLFMPHVKLWIHISYRLYWVNQNNSGIFTSVLSKGLYW